MSLTDSIIVMNWESISGVPKGTKWAKKCLVFFVILKSKKHSQKGRAKHNVKLKCAVNVKT